MAEIHTLHTRMTWPRELRHPHNLALYHYWRALKPAQGLPARAELDLRKVKELLPWLGLLQRQPDEDAFQWRLTGSGLDALLGDDRSGRAAFSGWPAFERSTLQRRFAHVARDGRPFAARLKLHNAENWSLHTELLALPVAGGSGGETLVLACLLPFKDERSRYFGRAVGAEMIALRAIRDDALGDAAPTPPPPDMIGRPLRLIDGGRS
ncbi:MAG TPA: PAS domain-containing protein [Thermopetrobacter sp.]|nr:PAS domain-containing protein [Thermopetrobacter sp.]